jgi:excisionase family DNA binding protein
MRRTFHSHVGHQGGLEHAPWHHFLPGHSEGHSLLRMRIAMKDTASTNTAAAQLVRPLLDVNETATMLHISVRYVRVLLARKSIPVVRLGRRTLVRRADIEAVIARGGLQKVG